MTLELSFFFFTARSCTIWEKFASHFRKHELNKRIRPVITLTVVVAIGATGRVCRFRALRKIKPLFRKKNRITLCVIEMCKAVIRSALVLTHARTRYMHNKISSFESQTNKRTIKRFYNLPPSS